MEYKKILAAVDHTCLRPTVTWQDIKHLCDEGTEYGVASVCLPPCFVQQARDYVGDNLSIGTVIGFPNGYQTARVKAFEAQDAVCNGANEVDMVINLTALKDKNYEQVFEDILAVRKACTNAILKVIIETCFLTQEEKLEMCRIVSDAGADYIKTSTGFVGGGAILEDVRILAENIPSTLKIKAAGGIRTFEEADAFLLAGASRIGTSSLVQIAKDML